MSDDYVEVAIFCEQLDLFAFFDEPRRFMVGWEATMWIASNPPPPYRRSIQWMKVDNPATARLKTQCVTFDSLIHSVQRMRARKQDQSRVVVE
jgi:hypothetical protein